MDGSIEYYFNGGKTLHEQMYIEIISMGDYFKEYGHY